MTDLELKKSLLSCPGATIQEHIDFVGMSQAELAQRLGRTKEKLNELIKGKAPITKETAIKLEYVLDIPASFWLNLERQYQDELLEIEQMEKLEKYKEWSSGFPLRQMKKWGIIPDLRDKIEIARNLLKYFRVASPEQWSAIYNDIPLAFKIELRHTTKHEAISVWLRLGELQAEKILDTLDTFDKKKIKANYGSFHTICYNHADHWLEELQSLCASCGIALVYTPCIEKAPIYGASRWIKKYSTPLIQITDRRKDYHAFWFTFYHELAHILKHGKKDISINGLDSIHPDKEKEAEANAFAKHMLLSEKEKNELFSYKTYDTDLIVDLGKKFRRHPSIIVGQLQREYEDLYKDALLNSLRAKVVFEKLTL